VGGGPIADYAQFVVDLSPFEPRPLGTFPMIRMLMKSEAAMVILARTPMRMPSHHLKTGRDDQ
jgi:hypothetical protein